MRLNVLGVRQGQRAMVYGSAVVSRHLLRGIQAVADGLFHRPQPVQLAGS